MTLGLAERQGDLLDEVNRFCEQSLPPNSVFAVLHRERDRLFPDELFADLFSARRLPRPAAPHGAAPARQPAHRTAAMTARTSYGVSAQEAAQMRLGRLMSRETVRTWRNLSEEEMDAYIASGHIVGVTFDDGTVRFPVAQFGQPRDPRIVAVAIAAFRDLDATGLLAASWPDFRRSQAHEGLIVGVCAGQGVGRCLESRIRVGTRPWACHPTSRCRMW